MEMWQACITSSAKNVPAAKFANDEFHITQYLGETVEKICRAEHRELKLDGERPLTGLRQLFLYSKENLDEGNLLRGCVNVVHAGTRSYQISMDK